MSDTPRTDAVANDACDDTGRPCMPEILLDLCRRLEQDLKVANEFNRGLANSISEFTAKAEDARNSAKIAWQRAEKTEKQLAEMTAIAEELELQLRELLRMYCLVQRCEIGHPCPENISSLAPMYATISRLDAARGTCKQNLQVRSARKEGGK